jgi:hypothetical protein
VPPPTPGAPAPGVPGAPAPGVLGAPAPGVPGAPAPKTGPPPLLEAGGLLLEPQPALMPTLAAKIETPKISRTGEVMGYSVAEALREFK